MNESAKFTPSSARSLMDDGVWPREVLHPTPHPSNLSRVDTGPSIFRQNSLFTVAAIEPQGGRDATPRPSCPLDTGDGSESQGDLRRRWGTGARSGAHNCVETRHAERRMKSMKQS